MKALNKFRDGIRLLFNRARYDFANAAQAEALDFSTVKQIVFSKIDGKLGDTQIMSGIFPVLKQSFPEIKLTVLTSANVAPLYKLLSVDQIIICSKRPDKAELDKIAEQIGSCELFVTLEAYFRFHDFYLLHKLQPVFVAGINDKVKSININLQHRNPDSHITDYFRDLLSLGGIKNADLSYVEFVTDKSIAAARQYCRKGQILLAPWGASKHKHLSDQVIVQIAEAVLHHTDKDVVLMVPPAGNYLHDLLNQKLDSARLVAVPDTLSVLDLPAVVSLSHAVISVDTAYVHLACASHLPLFALYNGNSAFLTRLWAPVPGKHDAKVFCQPDRMLDELSFADFSAELTEFLTQYCR